MKKALLNITLCCLFLLSCSDKKTTSLVRENPFEVTPANFRQNVLMECFVAEWASESIQATSLIEELKTIHPHRVFSCNLHVGDWLETPYSDELSNQLGGLIELPKAAINREPLVLPSSLENGFSLLSTTQWSYQLSKVLSSQAKAVLALESKWQNEFKADLNVYIAHKEAIEGDTRVQVYLIQDSIVSSTQSGTSDFYVHQDVFRNVVLPSLGEPVLLNEAFDEGEIKQVSFSNIDLQNLDKSNLRFLAILYQYNTDFRKMKILNVQEVGLGGNKYWD